MKTKIMDHYRLRRQLQDCVRGLGTLNDTCSDQSLAGTIYGDLCVISNFWHLFTESALRPIQSISRDVRLCFVSLWVTP